MKINEKDNRKARKETDFDLGWSKNFPLSVSLMEREREREAHDTRLTCKWFSGSARSWPYRDLKGAIQMQREGRVGCETDLVNEQNNPCRASHG